MPSDRSALSGRTVAGRYRLGPVLGSGGSGVVREGEDVLLRRRVAIKEVRLPLSASQAERDLIGERVLREARAAARLHHPGLVTVYDVVDEDDHPWIIMEYVDGSSLAQLVRDEGPLSPLKVARIGISLAYALEAAHRGGVVHRDVKPGNVLITRDGQARLTDFGIAVTEGDATLTGTGMLLGSPAYIAPERARGHSAGAAGDVWGLGATLFTAVEGVPPFAGEGAIATLAAVVEDRRRPFRRAGPLRGVLTELLDSDPTRRPSLAEARGRLREIAERIDTGVDDAPGEPVDAAGPASTKILGVPPARVTDPDSARPAPAATPPATDGLDVLTPPGPTPAPRPTPAPPQPQREAPPDPPARTSDAPSRFGGGRRVAVAALAGAVVVVVAAVLAVVLTAGGGSGDSPAAASASASAGTGARASSAPAAGDTLAPRQSASPTPSPSPSVRTPAATGSTTGPLGQLVPSSTTPARVPAGYTLHRDSTGWSVSLPAGWARTGSRQTGSEDFAASGGYPKLRIEVQAKAGPSAIGAWRQQEASVAAGDANYHLVGFTPEDGADGTNAANWEFTTTSGGQTIHVLDFGVVRNGHGYALLWRIPEAQWRSEISVMRTITSTFRPGS